MNKIIPVLRFFIALPFFIVAIVFYGALMIIFGPFTHRFHHRFFQGWASATVRAAGLTLHAEGLENIDLHQQYIFACNHQSLLDVPVLTRLVPVQLRFVAKSSLAKIPYFSAILRQLGTICIDRKNHQSAIQRLLESQKDPNQVAAGILFFAEGTRTSDGEIGPFKKGAIMTALSFQVPIVPLAIAGPFEALPKGSICLRPGHIRLRVGKPIVVGENTPEEKERLLQVVPQEVKALYESIRHDLTCQAAPHADDVPSAVVASDKSPESAPNASPLDGGESPEDTATEQGAASSTSNSESSEGTPQIDG